MKKKCQKVSVILMMNDGEFSCVSSQFMTRHYEGEREGKSIFNSFFIKFFFSTYEWGNTYRALTRMSIMLPCITTPFLTTFTNFHSFSIDSVIRRSWCCGRIQQCVLNERMKDKIKLQTESTQIVALRIDDNGFIFMLLMYSFNVMMVVCVS